MRYGTLANLLIAALSSVTLAAHANLISNGGFETGDFTGWTIAGDGISIDTVFPNSGLDDAAFGSTSNDPTPGVLSQDVSTTPGQDYLLSFALLDEAASPLDSFTVSFGAFSATITGDAASSYTTESFAVPGADIVGGTTTLSFEGLNDNADWNLDDVALDAVVVGVPEPGEAQLLAGILLLAVAAQVRRTRAR